MRLGRGSGVSRPGEQPKALPTLVPIQTLEKIFFACLTPGASLGPQALSWMSEQGSSVVTMITPTVNIQLKTAPTETQTFGDTSAIWLVQGVSF